MFKDKELLFYSAQVHHSAKRKPGTFNFVLVYDCSVSGVKIGFNCSPLLYEQSPFGYANEL